MYVLHGDTDVNQGWLKDSWTTQVNVFSSDAKNDGYGPKFNGDSSMIGNVQLKDWCL